MTGTEPHAWGTGLMDNIIFVGLDVHKATVCIAVAEGGRGGEVRQLGIFENRPEILSRVVLRLSKGGRRLSFCYEAGPCGYGLHRLLTGYGHECVVVAPSLIPMKAGDRVKTDRRDALMLAKLHRAGELTAIWIPDAAHEAMRDLVRARATAVRVLSKARQNLQGFLLRHDKTYPGARAGVGLVVTKQKALQILSRLTQHPNRGCACADQIAHRLVRGIRDPDRR